MTLEENIDKSNYKFKGGQYSKTWKNKIKLYNICFCLVKQKNTNLVEKDVFEDCYTMQLNFCWMYYVLEGLLVSQNIKSKAEKSTFVGQRMKGDVAPTDCEHLARCSQDKRARMRTSFHRWEAKINTA